MIDLRSDKAGTISQIMADYVLGLKLEDVPQEVLDFGKLLIMDTLGVAVAVHGMEHAEIIKDAVLSLESAPQATLWCTGKKVGLPDAVLYNGALVHGMDYDDTHVEAILHPSAIVVTTALTVGEMLGSSGKDILEAIIAGWEVSVRLSAAARGRFHDVGFHATGIIAPFGAACVAAKLMGLSREVLVNALGICGSMAAALQEFLRDGSWNKKIHPGWGCHAAIYSLMLAKRGFIGVSEVFEGIFGIWNTHLGTTEGLFEEFNDLGKAWRTPEINVKLYPVCHFTHSFIDCALAIKEEQGVNVDQIEAITCITEKRILEIVCEPREKKIRPDTDYMMRFSLPYLVAIALLKDRVSPHEIDLKLASSPEVLALVDKVACVADEKAVVPGFFPGWVIMRMKDGSVYERRQLYQRGTPQNPMQTRDIEKKFDANMSFSFGEGQIRAIKQMLFSLETLSDAAELVQALKDEGVAE